MSNGKGIEFWLEYASNYTYLSVMRIESRARELGVSVIWKPFLLGPIFKSFGWDTSPFVLQKEKGAYMWNDMVRQCRKYDLPWERPTSFPRLSVLPARIGVLGAREPWMGEFSRRVMRRNFAEDKDIHTEDSMREVLGAIGLDAERIIAGAQSDTTKAALRSQTEAAQARGIFGAPTFFAKGEMFWGNDRLDDALELAASS